MKDFFFLSLGQQTDEAERTIIEDEYSGGEPEAQEEGEDRLEVEVRY